MSETYVIQLTLEDDEVDWEVFVVHKNNERESIDRAASAGYDDAVFDAARALRPFMPEVLL